MGTSWLCCSDYNTLRWKNIIVFFSLMVDAEHIECLHHPTPNINLFPHCYVIFCYYPIDPLTVAAPQLSPSGHFTAGQTYTLNCIANVHGGENLFTTTAITWTQPSGNVTSKTGSSLSLSLKPLRVSDAGSYMCTVSVSSPFLTRLQNSSGTLIVNVTGMK